MRICALCKNSFKDYQGKCRARCGSCNTKIRRYRTKAAAIKYLGGKCMECGWRGNQAALQFHHINFKKKDFSIGNVANKSWNTIKLELQKCILLCANCHSITHSTKDDKLFILEAKKYKGKKFDF